MIQVVDGDDKVTKEANQWQIRAQVPESLEGIIINVEEVG